MKNENKTEMTLKILKLQYHLK